MNSFQHYNEIWAKTRNQIAGKPLQRNTRLFKRAEDCFAIRLHATDVVTLFEDGRIVLDTGGWYTMVTKDRICGFAPVMVYSERGIWYVEHQAAAKRAQARASKELDITEDYDWWSGDYKAKAALRKTYYKRVHELCRVPYFDGIMFGPGGKCLNGIQPAQWAKYLRERDAMTKRIQTYCTGFNRALGKAIPMPGPGDC